MLESSYGVNERSFFSLAASIGLKLVEREANAEAG